MARLLPIPCCQLRLLLLLRRLRLALLLLQVNCSLQFLRVSETFCDLCFRWRGPWWRRWCRWCRWQWCCWRLGDNFCIGFAWSLHVVCCRCPTRRERWRPYRRSAGTVQAALADSSACLFIGPTFHGRIRCWSAGCWVESAWVSCR